MGAEIKVVVGYKRHDDDGDAFTFSHARAHGVRMGKGVVGPASAGSGSGWSASRRASGVLEHARKLY